MTAENKSKFLIHGGILAIAGILVRVIGMLYRIPMLNIIGGEGTGIYSAAFNVYNIILVLSSYGLPMAVSKLVSARIARKQYRNTATIFRCSLIISLVTGGTAALVLFFGADAIEHLFYHNIQGVAIPLRILAPTVFIVAVLGVFRGFYQGQGTMIPTAVSQLGEQVINAVVSVAAGYLFMKSFSSSPRVAAYGAAGGTLGTCLGALTALLFFIFLFLTGRKKFRQYLTIDTDSEDLASGAIYQTIILTMIPIILGQTFYNISAVLDDILFNNMMTGASGSIATDLGNYNTSYVLLMSIPQGVASAMSASMLPSIVNSYTMHKKRAIHSKLRKTLRVTMMISIPSFVGLTVLGQPIIRLLFSSYNSVQGAQMLKIGSVAVVFYTLSTVTGAALQGIDKMSVPVKHSVISLAVHLVLVLFLLQVVKIGIFALVIGTVCFPLLVFILNFYSLYRYIGYRQELIRTFILPLGCSAVMGILSLLSYNAVYALAGRNIVALPVACLVAVISYFGSLMLCNKYKLY